MPNLGLIGLTLVSLTVGLLWSGFPIGAPAAAESTEVARTTPLFVEPIKLPPSVESDGKKSVVILDMLRSDGGPAAFLVAESERLDRPPLAVLVGVGETGFGAATAIRVSSGMHMARGVRGSFWVGGSSNARVSAISMPRSEAYLAHVDELGRTLWEGTFGVDTARSIESMRGLPSGDVIVSGRDSRRTWLARISPGGRLIWERFVGLGQGSAVAVVDDVVILTALEGSPGAHNSSASASDYREDVGVWSFTTDGAPLRHAVVRKGLNGRPNYWSSHILDLEIAGKSVYVISRWPEEKAIEVARVDPDLNPIWSSGFEGVAVLPTRTDCRPVTAPIADDLLVLCAVAPGQFLLTRLNGRTGQAATARVQMVVPRSGCGEIPSFVRFMEARSTDAVLLYAAFSGGAPTQCGWVGLVAPPDPK